MKLTLKQVAANNGCSEAEMKERFRQILSNLNAGSDPKTNGDYRWCRAQAKAITKRMVELSISTTDLPAPRAR